MTSPRLAAAAASTRTEAEVRAAKLIPTPGPWDYFVGNANGRGLIRIEQLGTGVHIASLQRGAVSEANARLIAAAPTMSDFVALVAGFTEPGRSPEDDAETLRSLIQSARAIRAQATGAP